MADNYRNKPGLARVLRGKYQLYDRDCSRELSLVQHFQSVFRPGRHIRQSILFECNECPRLRCPKCDRQLAPNSDQETQWYEKAKFEVYSAYTLIKEQCGLWTLVPQSDKSPRVFEARFTLS